MRQTCFLIALLLILSSVKAYMVPLSLIRNSQVNNMLVKTRLYAKPPTKAVKSSSNKTDNNNSPPENPGNKYVVAFAIFIGACFFDKFIYHANPAHDDALYKSSTTTTITSNL